MMMIFRALIITAICCMGLSDTHGQPTSGDPNGGGKPGVAPISGIEILIGLGGLLGARRLLNFRKKN